MCGGSGSEVQLCTTPPARAGECAGHLATDTLACYQRVHVIKSGISRWKILTPWMISIIVFRDFRYGHENIGLYGTPGSWMRLLLLIAFTIHVLRCTLQFGHWSLVITGQRSCNACIHYNGKTHTHPHHKREKSDQFFRRSLQFFCCN
jgi:hypothetical protein